jgi:steroid delta-isomerase-like uncharacterized protein
MSVDGTESTVRQYLDALMGGGDFAAHFSDDVTWTTMETGDRVQGRDAVRAFILALHTEFFDASPELVDVTFSDGVAGLEAVFAGTHTAEFAGIPPTGAAVRLPYSVFYEVSGEKIVALRAYFPVRALAQQLAGAASARA